MRASRSGSTPSVGSSSAITGTSSRAAVASDGGDTPDHEGDRIRRSADALGGGAEVGEESRH